MNRAKLNTIELIASAEGNACAVDQGRDQREPRRLGDTVIDPKQQNQREQDVDRDQVDPHEQRQQGRAQAAVKLGDADDTDPVAAVGEDAGERTEEQDRKELGKRDKTEPGARMRQRPGQPADRDALQPGADQRDAVAADVDPIIAVGEGAGEVVEPSGREAQTLKSQ